MAEGVGDGDGLGWVPALLGWVCVVVKMERSVGRCVSEKQPPCDSAESFSRAEERGGVSQVANLFTLNGILLVSEGERCVRCTQDLCHVMQRCVGPL